MKVFNDLYEIWRNLGNLHFSSPQWLWLGAAIFVLVPLWKSLGRALPNTFVSGHNIRSVGWPSWITATCLIGSWLFFTIALSGPKFTTTETRNSYQAREFEVLIDGSGSMFTSDVDDAGTAAEIAAWEQTVYQKYLDARAKTPSLYPVALNKPPEKPADATKAERFALARYAAWKFVRSRMEASQDALSKGLQGDRVGVGTFDDEVHPSYPLTSELGIPLRKVEHLSSKSGGGTNFEGPTENEKRVGAFQYCINEFKQWGKKNVKTKVMIFVSDGDAGISPERHDALVQQMTQSGMNIHVYALVCGPKTQVQNSATESMRKLIEAVNPNDPAHPEFQQAVLWAGDGQAMKNAFTVINRLEKSTVEGEPVTVDKDVRRRFILAGSLLAALFILSAASFRENL
jgi:hypothetical protein